MPYQLTKQDFEYFIPRHDQIMSDQIIEMGACVYPGVTNAYGCVKKYTHPDTNIYLFIDEREPAKNVFFLGGIVIEGSQIIVISNFIKEFKKLFRPELNPEEWFLKGSGEWIDNNNQKNKETKEEALTKWILWSKNMNDNDVYTLHASITLKKDIKYSNNKKKQRKTEYFKVALESLLKTLTPHKHSNITIVTDNIEGGQKERFLEVFEESKKSYNLKDLEIIKKDDFNSSYSNLLQFVDMQIFALSRYIIPTDSNNILMGFEEFAYEHRNKTIIDTFNKKGPIHIDYIAAKYHIIKKIYHHLRKRIMINQYMVEFGNTMLSSIVLTGKEQNLNIGHNINASIGLFMNNHNTENFNVKEYLKNN